MSYVFLSFLYYYFVFLLVVGVYFGSIGNGFQFDDVVVGEYEVVGVDQFIDVLGVCYIYDGCCFFGDGLGCCDFCSGCFQFFIDG